MISLTYIGSINLCVLCVFVVRSSRSRVASALRPLAGLYFRIHFTHQTQESQSYYKANSD
ncbi:MAG: hypothetical protein EWV75_09025 [Microcystis wesenbergii Mw_QC_S_20081001_S30D]|uniref:Uncharacterized protein n=2 Tax=Microcystis wesenbergii TaxID=44823 RepID=A0A552M0A2_9CHRO|nr:hypothetical protein [Microcystis aeruginosa W11-03]NCR96152.1 hypothetical protein [Microcystis aeruginosa W11-06]TRU97506.1 MAG: hypothetical protein EWV75_09025 [Microcystis wesenbergii Mw_QC_S_20081001_S30D]TRV03299.1 MAG: hypothetical protein EWV73_05325 [Microcystis wesenbergii Mw_QC_B_20070930_S4D]TRV25893.1 MAG: hypothetical protein EWV88_07225 [Microcystis wesenbergii Mw_MB_S_20031200_S109D]